MDKWIDDVIKSWEHIQEAIYYEQAGGMPMIRGKIVDLLADNPNPPDSIIHKFADDNGIAPDKLEAIIYGMLSEIIEKGKGGTPDPKELAMGIKVEMEHTSCMKLAEWIAKTHLKEMPDYYTKLKKMEGK